MRLYKEFTLAGTSKQLVRESIHLAQNRPGKAVFVVFSEREIAEDESGEVSFSLGWNFEDGLLTYFTGYVERCARVDKKQYKLFCAEAGGKLLQPVRLNLRHPTFEDIISAYAEQTGLIFQVEAGAYLNTKIPAFYTFGSGLHGLNSLGGLFKLREFFWQCQGDGSIACGEYASTRWAQNPVELPEEFFINVNAISSNGVAGGAAIKTVNAVPALRPGVILNGSRVEALAFSGHQMELTCRKY